MTTTYGEETAVVSYASEQNPWQIDNKARKIATNTPATAKLNVYLRKGERLKVDTAIGLYHGRMDVTVKKSDDSLILATDRIDAFFPVHYEESFYVSNLNNSQRSKAYSALLLMNLYSFLLCSIPSATCFDRRTAGCPSLYETP